MGTCNDCREVRRKNDRKIIETQERCPTFNQQYNDNNFKKETEFIQRCKTETNIKETEFIQRCETEINNNIIANKKENDYKEKLQKMKALLENFEKKFEEIKEKNNFYYQDIQNQYNFIDNYKSYINEINNQINMVKEKLNISVLDEDANKILQFKNEMDPEINEIRSSLEIISNNNIKLKEIIYDCEVNKIKKIENIQGGMVFPISELKKIIKKGNINENQNKFNFYKTTIEVYLDKLLDYQNQLSEEKENYELIKKEIENEINNIKKKIKKLIEKFDKKKEELVNNNIKKVFRPIIDKKFLKNSMLLEVNIEKFAEINHIFDSVLIFNEENNINYNISKSDLLRRNWHEICEIYDDYDLHEVNYELLAIGLEDGQYFSSCSEGFYYDTIVEILEFEIDGKKSNFNYQNYSLQFSIQLKNGQTNKIHLKYKESPSPNKMTINEKKKNKFYRQNNYGLSKNLANQIAKFILRLKCDFDIICFEDEFFIKIDDEYQWGGVVPKEGKRTLVKLSKKEAQWSFNYKQSIKSITEKNINKTELSIPILFEGGNNQIKSLTYTSNQTNKIQVDNTKRKYIINFEKTNSNIGEFIIKGELKNKCKGDWECNLTNEEIEKNIPKDYKKNKEQFKKIAEDIIKEYDIKNKKNENIVLDIVKVGKWVKKNIKYDMAFKGRKDLTATDIYNKKKGVCEHLTKLFNAFVYSLGYQVIDVSGYVIKENDVFDADNGHAWSLIKVDNKWLPFDATWGIFSGKLPVCHVFTSFFGKSVHAYGTDQIEIVKAEVCGKFIG